MLALILLIFIGAASANDNVTSDDAIAAADEDSDTQVFESGNDVEVAKFQCNESNIIKGHEFSVKLTSNSTGLANKTVHFTVNNKQSNSKTNDEGIAKIKINLNPGKYKISFSFNETGFKPVSGSKTISVFTTSTSKIQASAYTAYQGLSNPYKVTLKAGSTPLSKRVVTFTLNGKTFDVKTNSKGEAKFNIDLTKGSYTLKYSYAGEKNIKPVKGSVRITVKKGIATKIIKVNSIVYRDKTSAPFKVKVVDARGNIVANKKVVFKVNSKTYSKKTNKKGIASVNIKLKIGKYNVKVTVSKSSKYNKASKTYGIKVKPKQARNNGMWLLSVDMKSVDFDKLQKYGTKHIFLNAKALENFGKKYVESWIKDAKSHKIKVHLWMQVFYSKADGWKSPVKNGKINYKLINSKVKEAKKLAKVKGVAGVHFDYLRFPGNAYEYKNGVKAINYFTKKASAAVHKVNKKLIVSAAVMPEPYSMKYYYGQDIPTMSKYLDAILPMVYKGNYHAGSSWIKQVTQMFVKQSKKAKIWTGLQTYRSDSNVKKIPASELMYDADSAALGGAYGVILFRYGLIDYINFNEV